MNIYVGNLSYQVTDAELKAAFEVHGEVSSAKVIQDKVTNRSKGFGFVEMSNQAAGEAAIKALNGADLKGRAVVVNEARPRSDAPRHNDGFRRNDGGSRRNEGFGNRQQRF